MTQALCYTGTGLDILYFPILLSTIPQRHWAVLGSFWYLTLHNGTHYLKALTTQHGTQQITSKHLSGDTTAEFSVPVTAHWSTDLNTLSTYSSTVFVPSDTSLLDMENSHIHACYGLFIPALISTVPEITRPQPTSLPEDARNKVY